MFMFLACTRRIPNSIFNVKHSSLAYLQFAMVVFRLNYILALPRIAHSFKT